MTQSALKSPVMRVIRSTKFEATEAWGSVLVSTMNGITTRVHWTDKPYKWHVNEGEEVFVVLDGIVDMHYREDDVLKIVTLDVGDVFFAHVGCEHVAHPRGGVRVLVVEHSGSV